LGKKSSKEAEGKRRGRPGLKTIEGRGGGVGLKGFTSGCRRAGIGATAEAMGEVAVLAARLEKRERELEASRNRGAQN